KTHQVIHPHAPVNQSPWQLGSCLDNLDSVGLLRVYQKWITLIRRNIMKKQIPSLTRAVRKGRTLQQHHSQN
ncbi:hypothetical protein KUCAC02_024934, partial [Chaenocephalus aceratus]